MATDERKDRENEKSEKIEDLADRKVTKDDSENVKGGGAAINKLV